MAGDVTRNAPGDTPGSHDSTGAEEAVRDAVRQVKPKLRGWLHAGMLPLSLVAGIVLLALAPTSTGRVGAAVFLVASAMLFGTSAVYHRFDWGPRADGVLRRMDHANIFVFIAATYTPIALLLVQGSGSIVLLSLVWGAAVLGLLFRLFWLSAPRALYTVLYLVVGWAALGWLGAILRTGGTVPFVLIMVGGLFYTFGAIVYATKRPNPSPRWFGFHEIFHACTIGGFVCHYIAISIATYTA